MTHIESKAKKEKTTTIVYAEEPLKNSSPNCEPDACGSI